MQIFFDRRQLGHAPVQELFNGAWAEHAEKPSRAEIVANRLGACQPVADFGLPPLARVHTPDYLDFLRTAHVRWVDAGRSGEAIGYTFPVVRRRPMRLDRIDALLGRYSYDAGTPIGPGTWDGAYWSAQTALAALQPLLTGEAGHSFALCRPPGHHAGPDYLGGYCYLNNAAIAAQAARDAGHGRVAILDIDYHHGNGTQDIFWQDGSVFFASIHADPATDYPYYWGHADEAGAGEGRDATLNLPLPRGTRLAGYEAALDQALAAIAAFGAGLLILSFGADTFEGDPISHFAIARADYAAIGRRVASAGLPTLVVMEGGYAVAELGDNVAELLSGF